ncbi:MAG: hypothetical protein H6714_03525 [Myxococcales bacterium]|nr:hypothetical protein [Myxococcales bacterium]
MIRKWLVLSLLFAALSSVVACDDDDKKTDGSVDVPQYDVPTYDVPTDVDNDGGDAS